MIAIKYKENGETLNKYKYLMTTCVVNHRFKQELLMPK